MVERAGALGYFGDARRAAVGTELFERVTATGSLVIRKLGETRAGELAIHRFLAAPSVTCREMLETLAERTLAAAGGRRIVVAQDTTEINFAGREANRRGLGPAGDGVSAGFFIHPLVAIDSETEAVPGLLDAHIWTRADAAKTAPRRRRGWSSTTARTTSTVVSPAVRRGLILSFVQRKIVLWSKTHRCSPARQP